MKLVESIHYLKRLVIIDLSLNQLYKFYFTKDLSKLIDVKLNKNNLKNIEIENYNELAIIGLSFNKIDQIKMINLHKLAVLDLKNNHLNDNYNYFSQVVYELFDPKVANLIKNQIFCQLQL